MTRRRLAAALALAVAMATLVLAVVQAVTEFPRGLWIAACVVGAFGGAWYAILHRGTARFFGLMCAGVALAGAVVLLLTGGPLLEEALVVVGVLVALGAARAAFAVHVPLHAAPRPQRPVLFMNPRSGGGKATKFALADEARARGIEPIELGPGDDLVALVRKAVDGGADALAMAGGDGSQAIVATAAAEHGLPYACIPAGTRNHFALDLGVDREDVVGALDAYVRGRERVVDLADVNGKVFVNNVSLGVYAEAVQREEYRDAKLRTLAATAPTLLGPAGHRLDLEWADGDGGAHRSADVILVSNDPYRLGRALASGTRPSLDRGVLGVAAAADDGNGGHLRTWSAPAFEVGSKLPIAAGIDGEAVTLDPPLRFRTRPRALHVLLAPQHPGASP